jgi:outer membrane protein insertion porin family
MNPQSAPSHPFRLSLLSLSLRAALAGIAISQTAYAQLLPSEQSAPSPLQNGFVISDIRIEGLERISAGTVLTYLPLEKGDRLDPSRAATATRALFKTGFFNDVKFERDDDILVITVQERPAISKVTLIGNKDIKEPDLRKALAGIGLSEGEVYNRLIIDKVQQELTRQYYNRGKYNVKVTPSVKKLDRNRVDVTISIGEGKASKIRHWNIVGNKRFTDEEIMEGFEAKTTNWLSWYKRDDQYAKEKIQGDLEKLRAFYLDRGYVDFDIESTQVSMSPDRKDIYITANVSEGEVYKIKDTKLTGTFIIGQDALEPLVFTQPGDIFSRRRLEQTSEAIKGVLANVGYAFAEVQPIPEINKEKREVSLNFFVTPGKRVYVRRIKFLGNLKTQDEVLRREMRLFEGSWFSQAEVDRTKIRLGRLGYVEADVKIETPKVAGTDDQVDIEITVKERQVGNFQFGFGYSAFQGGLITNISLDQDNFLGRGNRVGLALSNSLFNRSFSFSHFNPYWTDDGVSRGFSLNFRDSDYSQLDNVAQYQNNTIGLTNSYSVPITETDRINFQIGVDQSKLRLPIGGSPTSYLNFINENGARGCAPFTNGVSDGMGGFDPLRNFEDFQSRCADFLSYRAQAGWARDTRNRALIPTAGSYIRLGAEATLPGSDLRYVKFSGEYQRFFPLTYNLVFMTRTEIGVGENYGKSKSFPFFENFYGGGTRSVRGFRDNTLGPQASNGIDPATGAVLDTFAIGGAMSFSQTFEVLFPTPFAKDSESVRLAAFVDAGQVYKDLESFSGTKLRYSAGLSMQWRSPVAPIIISFAEPLNDKPGDDVERLQFTFLNGL